jgi:hypothetical protein
VRKREWQRCTDAEAMLRQVFCSPVLSGEMAPRMTAVSLRRHRIFTLSAGEPVLERVAHPTCRAAAEVGWRLVEGMASLEEVAETREALRVAYEASIDATRAYLVAPVSLCETARLLNVLVLLFNDPWGAARNLIVPQTIVHPGTPVPLLTSEELRTCCWLLRDVFGERGAGLTSPWWQDDWRTDTAVSLASTMYESRDFSAMPILADALQDAGCDNDDILDHCRDANQAHVRGCWVVDLVLGKA